MIIKAVFLLSVFHFSLSEDAISTKDEDNSTKKDYETAQDGDREGWPGYKYYPQVNSYLKLHTDTADWHTARINCHDEDAVLAAPINVQMDFLLRSMVSFYELPAIYLAVQANYPEGIYEYRDGIPKLSLNSELKKLEQCAAYENIKNSTSMSWINCQYQLPYVCQAPSASVCGGKGYELDPRTGQCYKFHTQCLPWNEAHRTCLDDGAHLAIANSQTEAKVLVEIFEKYPFEALNGTHPLWGVMAVGFYYWKDADKYVTIYGQTLEEAGYAKWSNGNPSSRGKSKELGGGMFRSGLLDDVDKSYKVPFICEKKPIKLQLGMSNDM